MVIAFEKLDDISLFKLIDIFEYFLTNNFDVVFVFIAHIQTVDSIEVRSYRDHLTQSQNIDFLNKSRYNIRSDFMLQECDMSLVSIYMKQIR